MWGAVAPTKWRSAKSAPPRQASTALPESLRCRPRVRSMQTGGGPLRPAGYRAHLNRRTNAGPSLTLGDPGGGSARPLLGLTPSSACGSGRCAPCGRVRDGPALAVSARSPSLRSGGKSARGHPVPSENAYTDGTADSSSSYRLTLSAVPTVPAGGAPVPAPETPLPLRVARPLLALRLGGLRCAPSSLHCAPEPPLAGSSPCAGPSPRRGAQTPRPEALRRHLKPLTAGAGPSPAVNTNALAPSGFSSSSFENRNAPSVCLVW